MKPARSARRRFTSIALAIPALLLGACSHTAEPEGIWLQRPEDESTRQAEAEREQRGQDDVRRVQGFFDSLPRCGSQDVAEAVEVGQLKAPVEAGEVRVRGFVAPLSASCNAASCIPALGKPPPRCCNACRFLPWFVAVPGLSPAHAVMLEESSPAAPMKDQEVLDCAVSDLRESVPLPEVIALGSVRRKEASPDGPQDAWHLQGYWKMRATQLCVLEPARARVFFKDVARSRPPLR